MLTLYSLALRVATTNNAITIDPINKTIYFINDFKHNSFLPHAFIMKTAAKGPAKNINGCLLKIDIEIKKVEIIINAMDKLFLSYPLVL